MNLSRRLERMELARPAPLTAEQLLDLVAREGPLPQSRVDACAMRMPDAELDRAIAMLRAHLEGAQ